MHALYTLTGMFREMNIHSEWPKGLRSHFAGASFGYRELIPCLSLERPCSRFSKDHTFSNEKPL